MLRWSLLSLLLCGSSFWSGCGGGTDSVPQTTPPAGFHEATGETRSNEAAGTDRRASPSKTVTQLQPDSMPTPPSPEPTITPKATVTEGESPFANLPVNDEIQGLVDSLKSKRDTLLYDAIAAIGKHGTDALGAIPALVPYLADDDFFTGYKTKKAFQEIGCGPSAYMVYYWAPWCSPCKQTGPIVDKLIAEGYRIRKINTDDHFSLYIESVPTFSLVGLDKFPERHTGLMSEETLRSLLEKIPEGSRREVTFPDDSQWDLTAEAKLWGFLLGTSESYDDSGVDALTALAAQKGRLDDRMEMLVTSAAVPPIIRALALEQLSRSDRPESQVVAQSLAVKSVQDSTQSIEVRTGNDRQVDSMLLQIAENDPARAAPLLVPVMIVDLGKNQRFHTAADTLHRLKAAAAQAVPVLLRHVDDPQHTSAVAHALGGIGTPECRVVVPLLLKKLDDPLWIDIGLESLAKVAPLDPETIAVAVEPFVTSEDESLSRLAFEVIAQAHHPRSLPLLSGLFDSPDSRLRYLSIMTMESYQEEGSSVANKLLEIAQSKKDEHRRAAITAYLHTSPPEDSLPHARDWLADESLRYPILNGLVKLGPAAALLLDAILLLLDDEQYRYSAVHVLTAIGPDARSAIEKLRQLKPQRSRERRSLEAAIKSIERSK